MNERTRTIALLAHSYCYVATCSYRRATGGNFMPEIRSRFKKNLSSPLKETHGMMLEAFFWVGEMFFAPDKQDFELSTGSAGSAPLL